MSPHQLPMLSRPTSTRSSSPSAHSTIRTLVNDDKLGLEDFGLPLPPAAIITDRPTCYSPEPPSPLEDYPQPPPANFRHRIPNAFWENLPPLIAQVTSPNQQASISPNPPQQLSPTKSLGSFATNQSTDTSPSRASIAGTRAKHTSRASLFGNFFNVNATSEPLSIGVLPRVRRGIEDDEDNEDNEDDSVIQEDDMEYTSARPGRPRRALTSQPSTTNSSRFAWLTSKASSLTSLKSSPAPAASDLANDPLLNLDVSGELFPHGPADPLDPTSFHDLLTNAESLIALLQAGYRAKCAALEDLRREQSVQVEELDEAETRTRHLRTQLEDMSHKMAERERLNDELTETLVQERRRFREDEERRRRSIRKVRSSDDSADLRKLHHTPTPSVGSDSGFESDPESENGSVFSRSGVAESRSSADGQEYQIARAMRVKPVIIGSDSTACRNCHGTMMGASDLRSENHILRIRVAELEEAVEGCLDLVGGR